MADPRVRRRIRAVVDWLLPRVPHPGPYEFMAKDLRKIFGNTSNNALARWLMANVLQQTGFYQVGEFPYAYFIRTEGIEKMLTLLAGEEGQKRRVQRAAKSTIYDVQKLANEEPAHGWLLG